MKIILSASVYKWCYLSSGRGQLNDDASALVIRSATMGEVVKSIIVCRHFWMTPQKSLISKFVNSCYYSYLFPIFNITIRNMCLSLVILSVDLCKIIILVHKVVTFTCQYRPSVDHEMSIELGEVPRPKAFTGASMYSRKETQKIKITL